MTLNKFRLSVCLDESLVCGTYLKDSALSIGLLTPENNAFKWQRFLRHLKQNDILEIRKLRKPVEGIKE